MTVPLLAVLVLAVVGGAYGLCRLAARVPWSRLPYWGLACLACVWVAAFAAHQAFSQQPPTRPSGCRMQAEIESDKVALPYAHADYERVCDRAVLPTWAAWPLAATGLAGTVLTLARSVS